MRHLPFTSVVATLALFFLAGCLPESKNPLSSPANSRIDQRFEGVYAQQVKGDDDSGYWHFHYCGAPVPPHAKARPTPWLEILCVEHLKQGGLKTTRYEALTTRIGGGDYLSFYELPEKGAGTTGKGARKPAYKFARYEFNWRGELRVWLATNAEFAAAVRAGKIRGSQTKDKFGEDVKLTDTSEHLAAFIAASDAKELFGGKPMVMRRIRR